MGQDDAPGQGEYTMTAQKKSTVALLALAGAVLVSGLATGAMAQMGPEDGDHGPRMAEMFAAIDADSDGKVTQEELTTHRAAMFTAADTNGDGKLDTEELAARELARFTETLPDRTARMLERRDANGDGSIQASEIGEGPMEDHFARIDTDDDGAISQAEVEAMRDRFAEHRGKRKHGMMDGKRGDGWFN
jgi:Ca2+-binding EF-hand superfamily protein